MERLIKIAKQVRSLLFAFSGYIPLICVLCSGIGFLLYFRLRVLGSEPEWITTLDAILKMLSDLPLGGLIFMYGFSKNWKFITWLSWFTLLTLWSINALYFISAIDADTMYTVFMSIIYITFVILALLKLTNRC